MNSAVPNDAIGLKPEGYSVADVNRFKKVLKGYITSIIGSGNLRSMNQVKLEIVKQEKDHLNIVILGMSELKQTGLGHFQSQNYTFPSENDQLRGNCVVLIVR